MFGSNCLLNKQRQQQATAQHTLTAIWIINWVFVVCLLNPVLPEAIYRVDPLALLAATLRTYQRAACDSEQLTLSCPRGTSISIELAQYGRAGDLRDHSLCPAESQDIATTFRTPSGAEIEIKPPETCAINGLQYTLLQAVVGACQKKRHCKFSGNSTIVTNGDPCYGIRKFIEIAYKCRPYEFRSKVACEDDSLVLMCNPYSRIAIYSASFGHIERDSIQCGHNSTEVAEQACLVAYATETVMQICHGRRRCTVAADAGTFGRPCKTDVRMYLKVVYTCLPRKVLKDRYETAAELDEPQSDLEIGQDELYDEDQFYKESEAVPPKVQGAIPNAAGKPFDFNGELSQHATSTFMTPLLPYNESTLEDNIDDELAEIKESEDYSEGQWLENRLKKLIESTTLATDTATATAATTEYENVSTENEGDFIFRRKCQNQDEWGYIALNCTENDIEIERIDIATYIISWLNFYNNMKQNQEEFYLYLVISVGAGVLICLILVIGRFTLHRQGSGCSRQDSESDGKVSEDSRKSRNADGVEIRQNYEDDLSDIDTDIDLTAPTSIINYGNKNEKSYMTRAAASPSCAYNTSTNLSTDGTLLVPVTPGGSFMIPRHGQVGIKSLGSVLMNANRQSSSPPPPTSMYANMDGVCNSTISGTIAMAPRLLAPTPLSVGVGVGGGSSGSGSSPAPTYMTSSIVMPSHQHRHAQIGTLRRLMPTNVSVMGLTATQPVTSCVDTQLNMTGIPSASQVYYDSTMPRSLTRPMSSSSSQYMYG